MGRVKVAYDNGVNPYYFDASDMWDCYNKAADLLTLWESVRNEYKHGKDGTTSVVKNRIEFMESVARLFYGISDGEIDRLYVTWNETPNDGAGAMRCYVSHDCDSIVDERSDEVSMLLSISPDRNSAGKQTKCTVPVMDTQCRVNRINGLRPNTCTGLTADGAFGLECETWYDGMEENSGTPNRTTIVENLCTDHPWLEECMCQARFTRGDYEKYKNELFNAVSDVCWYQPCKIPGSDRLVTPDEERARNTCESDICGNFINVVNSDNIDIEGMRSVVGCSDSEFELLEEQLRNSGSSSDKDDDGGVFGDIGNSLTGILTNEDGSTNIAVYVGIGVVVLLLVLVLYRLFKKDKKDKK